MYVHPDPVSNPIGFRGKRTGNKIQQLQPRTGRIDPIRNARSSGTGTWVVHFHYPLAQRRADCMTRLPPPPRPSILQSMTLKNAATLALIGTLLLTVLLAWDFFNSVLAVARGLIPAMAVLRALIYLVASFTVAVFFYVFGRQQSR